MTAQPNRRWAGRVASAVVVCGTIALGAPAWAAQGSIEHVQPGTSSVDVLYSIPGVTSSDPNLESLVVSLDGEPLDASAQLASDAGGAVRRTTVLAIDVSASMNRGGKFEQAKLAAKAFLDTAPADVYVGIVTFAGPVTIAQEPTLNRAESEAIIDDLSLARGTSLYGGVLEALEAVGNDGRRSVLVLSDGRDTTGSSLADVVAEVADSQVQVDVVALAQSTEDERLLQQVANAGGGRLLSAEDPEGLTELFAAEADALARQILITADLPLGSDSYEGTIAVSVEAAGDTYTDDAFVTVRRARTPANPVEPTQLEAAPGARFTVTPTMMWIGLIGSALGFLFVLLGAFGVLDKGNRTSVEDRVAAYSRKSTARKEAARAIQNPQGMSAQAVDIAKRALESNKGLEASLGARLEAAGMQIKPAEWLLAHFGAAFAAGLLGLLLWSGSIVAAIIGVFLGALGPWVYLGFKRSRRVKAFKMQLADTLQLMSGSLSAGLSLAQSVDTVVREGSEPIAAEFRRALVEARLGVEIDDALDSVAERMESKDFEWVVMAIRIQREVGGNLAELLNTVAATIREREYLERQVSALSAEGRLSVWILGGLPPGFVAYLLVANPEYLNPMITTRVGWVLLGVMGVLITVGILWMKKLVKVEV